MKLKPKILNRLHNNNLLTNVLNIIRHKCNIHHIKFGKQVATFKSRHEDVVYKLTPMNIGYFKNNSFSPNDLLIDSEKMKYFYLPVKKIIYQDKNVFLYTQDYIKKLKILDPYIILSIMLIIHKMIQKDLVCTDIGIHNLGYDGENILLFDLQGLRNFSACNIQRLILNINRYLNELNIIYDVILDLDKTITLNVIKNIYQLIYDTHYVTFTKRKQNIIDFKSSLTFN